MPETITIHDGKTDLHQAQFEAVRSAAGYTLGWATIISQEHDPMRFPAIVDRARGRVLTVRDWQAPYDDVDLADPASVAVMLRCGQGGMIYPKSGLRSEVGEHFA